MCGTNGFGGVERVSFIAVLVGWSDGVSNIAGVDEVLGRDDAGLVDVCRKRMV